jgi:hypothetical protein
VQDFQVTPITVEQALEIDAKYQELVDLAPNLQAKNKIYREYRLYCQTGKIGTLLKHSH